MAKKRSSKPMVKFRRKDGKPFIKFFNSRASAARAVKAWRNSGGRVLKVY